MVKKKRSNRIKHNLKNSKDSNIHNYLGEKNKNVMHTHDEHPHEHKAHKHTNDSHKHHHTHKDHDEKHKIHEHKHSEHCHDHGDHHSDHHSAHKHHEHNNGHAHHGHHHEAHIKEFRNKFIVALLLTLPLFLLSETIQGWIGISIDFFGRKFLLFIFASFLYFYAGSPFLVGMKEELRNKAPGMMSLVGLAISVAFIYSIAVLFFIPGKEFFWELATLVDIMLLGHWIEAKAVIASGRALEEVTKLLPKKAHLITSEGIKDVEISQLKEGDIVLVKPSEQIPVDGIVIEGSSLVNESFLTGEAKPIEKLEGSKVIAGSINIDGSLKVKVLKSGEGTYLSQVVKLIQEASRSRTKIQDIADRAAGFLFYIAIFSGLISFFAWFFIKPFDFALERAIATIVVACPHALGLAIPLVVAISTAKTASNGILIRNRQVFEQLKHAKIVVFDKTGTLTKGNLFVTDVIGNSNIIDIAASIESHSEHIIAKAIVDYAKAHGIKIKEVKKFKAYPGKGAYGIIKGKGYWVGGGNLIKEKGFGFMDKDHEKKVKLLEKQGKTLVFVCDETHIIGIIALSDEIREESYRAIKLLKKRGIDVYMLTGDTEESARTIAKKLGIKYFANTLPHEKLDIIKKLKEKAREKYGEKAKVVMVGDGVNDAPALLDADIGIAIGAGTDLAIQSAEIILVKNNPLDVVKAIKFSEATYKKMIQNLWWASGYNIVAIPLAAGAAYSFGIILNPAIAAILMSLSTVVVAINATTLKNKMKF